DSKTAWKALGQVDYGRKSSEQGNAQFRRSLYFVKDMKAGDVVTEDCVRSVRPGYGLAPKYLDKVIGQKTNCAISANTPVKRELLSMG
ncbi:MAG: SAF domain-containing protein, partial [Pseudomonadota bacterium]|nr:SAF domain-containing protein [Pseudomonadota bacterium]